MEFVEKKEEFVEKKEEFVGKKGEFIIHFEPRFRSELDFIKPYDTNFTNIISDMTIDYTHLINAKNKFESIANFNLKSTENGRNDQPIIDTLTAIKHRLDTMINLKAETNLGSMNDIYKDDDGFVLRIMKKDKKKYHQSEYNSGYIQIYLSQQCETVPKIYAIGMYYPPNDKNVGLPFQLMENGGTELFDKLSEKENKIKFRKSFIDCINTIDCMHSNGIVHRDIKPENITVNEVNKMSVIDYGFSNNERGIRNNGIVVGTKGYNPYELNRLLNIDFFKQCDVYALARVLLDLETGNKQNILDANTEENNIVKIHALIDVETGIHKNIFKKYISILNPKIHTIENFLNDFKIYVSAMDIDGSNDPIQLPETSRGGKSQIKSKKKIKKKRRKTVKRKKRIHKKNTK
jgi:serine/threonine protein kinase